MPKHKTGRYTFPMWIKWLLNKDEVSQLDWFRLAQAPSSNWLKLLNQKLPRGSLSLLHKAAVDRWHPGHPVPVSQVSHTAPTSSHRPAPLHSDDEAVCTPGPWPCPVCDYAEPTPKGLRSHYDKHHAPQDPRVTTVFHSKCHALRTGFRHSKGCTNPQVPHQTSFG